MKPRRLFQLLLLFLLAFGLSATVTPSAPSLGHSQRAKDGNVLSPPRQSLPAPVHDEASCAFCQAAAFAPHAGSTAGILPIVWGTELPAHLSYDESFFHSGSTRPPRSRAPPSV